jgi:hypothetical protein
MAKHEMLEVVNNQVVDDDNAFVDGFRNGYLYYYDTNHQLARPLSCQAIYAFMSENLADCRKPERWNAGLLFGWVAALSENCPNCFLSSIALPEVLPVDEPSSLVALRHT